MKSIHEKMTFIHMKSFIYGHIHPCKWTKMTLYFKIQAQSSKLKLHIHAQAILTFLKNSQIFSYQGTLLIFLLGIERLMSTLL